MTCRRRILTTAALAFLTLGVTAAGAQAGKSGPNSTAAKLCQKGGWAGLATSTGAAFASEADCVSYAAGGGVLSPKASLVLSIGSCAPDGSGVSLNCGVSIIGSGLKPGATIIGCSPVPSCDPVALVDADGTLPDVWAFYYASCVAGGLYSVSTTTAAGNPIESSDTCSL